MNTNLPPHHTSFAKALVSLFGTSVAVIHTDRLSGGDINKAYGLTLNTGNHIFMKANAKENAAFFTAEAAGISAIESTHTIKTPEILCTGTDDGEEVGYSFLLLRFIESAEPQKDYWEIFARELAALHNADTASILDSPSKIRIFSRQLYRSRSSIKRSKRQLDFFFPRMQACTTV